MPQGVTVEEGGLRFGVDLEGGQKTGWFYDQRSNRDLMAAWAPGLRVLDLFSYVGAWGLRAAAAGASEVTCVDASADAVAAVARNAEANGLADRVRAARADAFDFLREARAARERWDLVILDPPAFVKRRKDFKEGALAYRRINEAAMQVLAKDGLLVTASCSYHMPREALLEAVNAAPATSAAACRCWPSCSRRRIIRSPRPSPRPITSRDSCAASCRADRRGRPAVDLPDALGHSE
jgi:23S rRNA (cytosine1962-C5)-methyltransferase